MWPCEWSKYDKISRKKEKEDNLTSVLQIMQDANEFVLFQVWTYRAGRHVHILFRGFEIPAAGLRPALGLFP